MFDDLPKGSVTKYSFRSGLSNSEVSASGHFRPVTSLKGLASPGKICITKIINLGWRWHCLAYAKHGLCILDTVRHTPNRGTIVPNGAMWIQSMLENMDLSFADVVKFSNASGVEEVQKIITRPTLARVELGWRKYGCQVLGGGEASRKQHWLSQRYSRPYCEVEFSPILWCFPSSYRVSHCPLRWKL